MKYDGTGISIGDAFKEPAPTPAPAAESARMLEAMLERLGWEIQQMDVDRVAGRLRVIIDRTGPDGNPDLRLTLDARSVDGRALLLREEGSPGLTPRWRGEPGDPVTEWRLLGRQSLPLRDALPALVQYIADNTTAPALSDAERATLGADLRAALGVTP